MLRSKKGITFNMCRWEIREAPPGGHISVEKMAIEQNFSGTNCHLRIDHPGMGR